MRTERLFRVQWYATSTTAAPVAGVEVWAAGRFDAMQKAAERNPQAAQLYHHVKATIVPGVKPRRVEEPQE